MVVPCSFSFIPLTRNIEKIALTPTALSEEIA